MKILISGSSGLVGSTLTFNLMADGNQVHRLVRSSSEEGIVWNPKEPIVDRNALEGFDAVVHLAGESISEGKWNDRKKKEIRESRTEGTRHLTEALVTLNTPPKVFVCASASGFYGNRGVEILTEESPAGEGFLPDVCKEWEAAAQLASSKGIRVVNTRFGIILSPNGGALKKMLPPFKMGVGGKIGSGDQFWSWIDLDDVIGIIEYALNTDSLQGPVNVSSPAPVTAKVFTGTLAHVLKRPAIFPVPAFAARAVLGEMANALVLCSFRMHPAKLIACGYTFAYPDLESSLRHQL
jgi:uncharacterized protein (TIGR01777 family)